MPESDVRAAILEFLAQRLSRLGLTGPETEHADLIGTGILDSLEVLALIEDVEARTGRRFSWDLLEAELGLSVPALADAFV